MTSSTAPDGASPGPRFTFLTTAYRSEDTLPRTIESVLAQTEPDWELIVVDNGYADAVKDVVDRYLGDPRISLVRQENRGAAGGTMAAAQRARGRYVVPLNSDDAIAPEYCARMADVFAAHPSAVAVTCDAVQFVDPGEQPLARTYLQSAGVRKPADGATPLRLADVIDGPNPYYTAAIRRDVFEAAGGLQSDTPLVDDLDLWLRLLVTGHDIRMIPDRLGRFRLEAGSVSRPDAPERIEEFEAQREKALVRAAEASGDPEAHAALRRVLRRQHYEQSMRRSRLAFRAGDTQSVRVHLAAASAERQTIRVLAVRAGFRVFPRLLSTVHPVKVWLHAHAVHAHALGLRRWLRHGRDTRRTS